MVQPAQASPGQCFCGAPLANASAPPGLAALACRGCGYLRTEFLDGAADRRALQYGAHPSAYQAAGEKRFSFGIGAVRQWCADYRVRHSLVGAGPAGAAALDFGCGQGFYLDALRHVGYRTQGVELSALTARQAAARGHAVARTLAELPPTAFEALVSIHVLEHVPDADGMLSAIVARLAPGARFHIEVPNFASLQARLFRYRWLHCEAGLHVHHFTPTALTALLGRHGLHIERRASYSFEHGYFGWLQSLFNTVFPYNRFFRRVVLNRPLREKLAAWPELLALPLAALLALPLFAVESLCGRGAVIRCEGRYRPGEAA